MKLEYVKNLVKDSATLESTMSEELLDPDNWERVHDEQFKSYYAATSLLYPPGNIPEPNELFRKCTVFCYDGMGDEFLEMLDVLREESTPLVEFHGATGMSYRVYIYNPTNTRWVMDWDPSAGGAEGIWMAKDFFGA